jgi:transposase
MAHRFPLDVRRAAIDDVVINGLTTGQSGRKHGAPRARVREWVKGYRETGKYIYPYGKPGLSFGWLVTRIGR